MFILDTLSHCDPKDEKKAQSICERITPRLAHDNAAVVLSAVKVKALKLTIFASIIGGFVRF